MSSYGSTPPSSRQRLLDHEGLRSDAAPLLQPDALRDAAEGPPTVRLQLVLLDFLPPERERDQEFLAACAENRAEPQKRPTNTSQLRRIRYCRL